MAVSTNTWKLYKNSKIEIVKNFKVDDVETYLQTLTSETIEGGQYFKHSLDAILKLDMNQSALDFFNESNNINYISIQNKEDTKPVFYFVVSKVWTAKKTITFGLHMDTINSFKDNFTLSEKTTITRQHKDRFQRVNNQLVRKIDRTGEGINPVLFRSDKGYVLETGEFENFYLIYRTNNDAATINANPVNCYLITDKASVFYVPYKYTNVMAYNLVMDYQARQAFVIIEQGQRVKIEGTSDPSITSEGISDETKIAVVQIDTENSPATEGRIIYFDAITGAVESTPESFKTDNTGFKVSIFGSEGSTIEVRTATGAIFLTNLNALRSSTTARTFQATTSAQYIQTTPLQDIVKTDVKLVKILKLPYSPDGRKVSGTYWEAVQVDDQDQGITFNALHLTNLSHKFQNTLTNSGNDPLEELKNVPQTINVNASPIEANESKLYSSEFYRTKFVIDSFGYEFALENANIANYLSYSTPQIVFNHTTMMKGSMLFSFPFYQTTDRGINDYDSVLAISQNNEEIIFNNDYINYLRTGYNYDTKWKYFESAKSAIQEGGAFFCDTAGVALNNTANKIIPDEINAPIGGWSASFSSVDNADIHAGAQALRGGDYGMFQGLMDSISNGINGIYSAITAYTRNQKMKELRNRASTYAGNDTTDLSEVITKNKLKLTEWTPIEELRDAIFKLFFFFGYAEGKRGVPQENTRYWFNYIQANVVFSSTSNLSEEIISDITARYAEGITILHKHGSEWNFEQDKENYETWLV